MADSYIWGNLTRTNADPTLIDEAIREAITAHNDDPDAHLGDGEALQSHRASEIIDHLAESVVNDKIRTNARAYVAIVDPLSATDYDTIADAVDYALGVGGGNILIMPGTHYIASTILLDQTITLTGIDRDLCKIRPNGTVGVLFGLTGDVSGATLGNGDISMSNLDIANTGNIIFQNNFKTVPSGNLFQLLIDRCTLTCDFVGFVPRDIVTKVNDSTILLGLEFGEEFNNGLFFNRCDFFATASGAYISADIDGLHLVDCVCHANGKTNLTWLGGNVVSGYISGCRFESWSNNTFGLTDTLMTNCRIVCNSTNQFRVDATNLQIVNSYITRVTLTSLSQYSQITGSRTVTAITNSGTGNVLTGNVAH